MEDDYYSLQSILADDHKLSCTFTLDVEGLGYLEGTESKISQNAKVELPFWLAQTLSLNEFTTFPLPPPYATRVTAALNASAPAVKLSHLVGGSGWWYRWGSKIADVLDDVPQADLLNVLLKAFAERLPALQDLSAQHASSEYGTYQSGSAGEDSFREGLEGDERELLATGQESTRQLKAWYDSDGNRKATKA